MFDIYAWILTGFFSLWFIECMWQLGKMICIASAKRAERS